LLFQQYDERAFAQPIACVDVCARSQGAVHAGRVGIAGGDQQSGVDGQVVVVDRLRDGATGDEGHEQQANDASYAHGDPLQLTEH